jgi:hypothetical protein
MAIAWLLSGCGALSNLVGGAGTTATTLWPDVPAMDGMTQENIDVPLPIRVAVQALMQASAGKEGVRVDNFAVVAYTTAKSPDDVKAFYTAELMRGAGWNAADQPGCAGTSEAQMVGGTFCLFGKQGTGGQSLLAIVAARNESDAKTSLFFLRFDGDVTATPSGS